MSEAPSSVQEPLGQGATTGAAHREPDGGKDLPRGGRIVCWVLGVSALVAGGVATFVRAGDVGTGALLLIGAGLTVCALNGRVPLRLRIKDVEFDVRRQQIATGAAELGDDLLKAAASADDEQAAEALEQHAERAYQLASTALDSPVEVHSFDQVIRSKRSSRAALEKALREGGTVRTPDAGIIHVPPPRTSSQKISHGSSGRRRRPRDDDGGAAMPAPK